jgi:hypothetical protein
MIYMSLYIQTALRSLVIEQGKHTINPEITTTLSLLLLLLLIEFAWQTSLYEVLGIISIKVIAWMRTKLSYIFILSNLTPPRPDVNAAFIQHGMTCDVLKSTWLIPHRFILQLLSSDSHMCLPDVLTQFVLRDFHQLGSCNSVQCYVGGDLGKPSICPFSLQMVALRTRDRKDIARGHKVN